MLFSFSAFWANFFSFLSISISLWHSDIVFSCLFIINCLTFLPFLFIFWFFIIVTRLIHCKCRLLLLRILKFLFVVLFLLNYYYYITCLTFITLEYCIQNFDCALRIIIFIFYYVIFLRWCKIFKYFVQLVVLKYSC